MHKVDPFSSATRTLRDGFLEFLEAVHNRKKGVVIASSQRCGTHLIGAHLKAVGIGTPGEHFLEYLNSKTDDLAHGDQLPESVRRILPEGAGHTSDAFSVVLMGYTQKITADLEAIGLSGSLLGRSLRHLSWIWLRRDWVDVAISHYFAVSSGIWESRAGHHAAPPFDAEKIRRWWRHVQDIEAFWQSFFTKHGIAPAELDYAQLVRDPTVLAPLVTTAGGNPECLGAATPPERMPHARLKQEYAMRFRDLLAEERSKQLTAQALARRQYATD